MKLLATPETDLNIGARENRGSGRIGTFRMEEIGSQLPTLRVGRVNLGYLTPEMNDWWIYFWSKIETS